MQSLRLIATSDLHMHVRPYDYFEDRADESVGLAALAPFIAEARAGHPCSLLLDNGDFLQGAPLGDVAAQAYAEGARDNNPVIAAMNAMGYDVAALGNHEFNYGLDYLGHALSSARFPVLCANLERSDGTPFVPPSTIITRILPGGDTVGAETPLRIGLMGLLPPQIMQWDRSHLHGRVRVTDIRAAAGETAAALRRAGADLVIALCHSGIVGGSYREGQENAAGHLGSIPGIDAIIAGHQHLRFPGSREFDALPGIDNAAGTINGIPAMMPGAYGSSLGLMDLALARHDGVWRVTGHEVAIMRLRDLADGKTRAAADCPARAMILNVTEPDHARTLATMRAGIGHTRGALDSHFALLGDNSAMELVAEAQREAALALIDALPDHDLRARDLPLLSAAAPFKAGGRGGAQYYTRINPGPLSLRDLANLYLYPNTVSVVRVTGAQLREWLERSSGIFRQIDPQGPADQQLLRHGFPSYHFDVVFGLTYTIDLGAPARHDRDGILVAPHAQRITQMLFEGTPVRPEQEFLVATNNYRAGGGGTFFDGIPAPVIAESTQMVREVVAEYVRARGTVSPRGIRNWRFAPLSRADGSALDVVFETGAHARGREPSGLSLTPIGEAGNGFLAYRLRLSQPR
ncbi:bifunctional 2',3'-cyclic-nucleotide 2'-phosphodiesterase/3'-nucleotidase [Saliniramus sp.]|uniref:bifunctional 2',3'-cyclic-nucleotide 2'-phosphodiesterase/3'-nucleotidase n=1 Tax=Saliniramus sp. TaxID=2986772 RepID=UPI002D08D8EE|nr:bifunctional 2',3'-cyclic-nucleotide 2'-phosphodiesterase/3'-nucleotidase [Saliniramus sp.]HMB11908.1 bifunctional 2',3'-cyclic-nucleotide 2'-phosphodiesterase/3'-nucleotidase [Saliniramus sp.]